MTQNTTTNDLQFLERILATRGNCTDLNCSKCPIEDSCSLTETKQATVIRAKLTIARSKHGGKHV